MPFGGIIIAGVRQYVRRLVSPRCLPSKKPKDRLSFESLCRSAATLGLWWQPPHFFIEVDNTSTRPLAPRYSRALLGRVRLIDFCRRIFQRAQSRTARAFQTSESVFGMIAWLADSCLLASGNRRSYAGSGAEDTDPRHSPSQLLVIATSPQPRSLQTLRVANIELCLALENTGQRTTPPGGLCDA